MAGEPLNAMEAGIYKTISSLKKDPHALETVYVSVISFAAKAKVLAPLTEVVALKPPSLELRPGTALGAALDLLRESIKKDVEITTAMSKGDWRPLVFILTDGQPTDDWRGPLARLRAVKPSLASVYGFGCGDEVDFETLAEVSDVCFQVSSLTTESLSKLFVWLTASIQKSVVSPDQLVSLEKSDLPMVDGMKLIDRAQPPKFQEKNARLYFHSVCVKTKRHYLIRYRFNPEIGLYFSEPSVTLPDDFFSDGAAKAPGVDASLLLQGPKCPYCQNHGWGKCGFCGHLFCLDPDNPAPTVVCPFCESHLTIDQSAEDFRVDGSVG
jgi:uncharacterized protein YegL